MQVTDSSRRSISSRQLAWLERESHDWREAGAIGEEARRLILGRYSVESAERRGIIAMILVAVAMCSVGLLLLIGYNWDQIPRAAKLTLVIGAVIAAFGASAAAYARERPVAGQTLAVLGTLLYGNAIWLVAQVLHIQGRDPDAFLWWGLGVLACAWLVRSTWVGAEGAALVLIWVFVEGTFTARHGYSFLLIWPLAIAAAYSLRSPLMLRIAAPAAALWVFLGGMGASHSAFWDGGIALTACALYGVGRWHEEDSPMRDAWEASGLVTLLLAFIPLMITTVHREMKPGNVDFATAAIAIAAAAAAFAASFRRARGAVDRAVLAVAAATLVWAVASWSGTPGTAAGGFAIASTVLFSILALLMSVSLVRTALLTSEISDLAAGIAFALLFLAIRWASVIENMLWSGVLMLSAGAGLLLVARLWRRRPRRVEEGRLP